jgi:ABC-2 type transport system permease protein
MICATQIAFLMGNLINNKEALNSIVNIIALGSSFLCGAFVPIQFLPDAVLKVAHILPSYWFIRNNEFIKELEIININTIEPYIINLVIIIIFILVINFTTNIISKKKRKFD